MGGREGRTVEGGKNGTGSGEEEERGGKEKR